MPKRKEAEAIPLSNKRRATDAYSEDDEDNVGEEDEEEVEEEEEDDDDDKDTELLDVEFEWFDPQEIDFQGLKVLLRQLFDVDNLLFDLSALANLILAQPLLGSTVKVGDADDAAVATSQTDPYAFLTVLNLATHANQPAVQAVRAYLASKARQTPSLHALPDLLDSAAASSPQQQQPPQVGLILAERFINMPLEVVPPMYNMLLEEIEWAVDANEPYNFSHYLILTKVYTEVASEIDRMDCDDDDNDDDNGNDEQQPQMSSKNEKKKRNSKKAASAATASSSSSKMSEANAGADTIHYFHAEDEALKRHALAHGVFKYTNDDTASSDAKRAFQEAGIRPLGGVILIEAAKFKDAVKAVAEFAAAGGAATAAAAS